MSFLCPWCRRFVSAQSPWAPGHQTYYLTIVHKDVLMSRDVPVEKTKRYITSFLVGIFWTKMRDILNKKHYNLLGQQRPNEIQSWHCRVHYILYMVKDKSKWTNMRIWRIGIFILSYQARKMFRCCHRRQSFTSPEVICGKTDLVGAVFPNFWRTSPSRNFENCAHWNWLMPDCCLIATSPSFVTASRYL